jgi:integrase
MLASGKTEDHAVQQSNRVKKIFEACGYRSPADVNGKASRILTAIDGFRNTVDTVTGKDEKKKHERKDLGPISNKTKRHYLKALKGFFVWLCKEGRINSNPVQHLSIKGDGADAVKRRALSVDEITCLLAATKAAKRRYGVEGHDRAILYRTAILTGLRSKELRALTVHDINLKRKTVTLSGEHTKNDKPAILPLRTDLVAELRVYLAGKLPGAQAFRMPGESSMARMLREDMADARTAWIEKHPDQEESEFLLDDTADGKVDFHGLRHTFGSLLAEAGVHPKKAMELMRHSDINLTMKYYTHTYTGQDQDAVDTIPGFTETAKKAKAE